MKKLLSIVMALAMIMSVFCAVPVSAEVPDNLVVDYEPSYNVSEWTGNFVNTPWTPEMNYNQYKKDVCSAEVITGVSRGEGWYEFTATRNLGHPGAVYDDNGVQTGINYQLNPLSGTNVNITKPASGTKGNVVFSFDVTIDSDNPAYGEQKVQIARRLNGAEGEKGQEYPAEYPGVDNGFLLTKDKIEKFQGTFKQVGDTDNANYGAYSVGLPMGSLQGARFEIRGENAYIGFEYPYDMAVSADMTTLYAGGSIVVDADILNQIGKDGDFDDSATWYAMNADRTAVADGFAVVKGEDGKATVSVDGTVEEGKYYLVAVSDNNADFVKGLEVEVGPNPYSDYVAPATMGGSLLTADPATTDVIYGSYVPDSVTSMIGTDSVYWRIWTQKAIPESVCGVSGYGVGGVTVDEKYINTSGISGGDTLIISTRIKDYANSPIFSAAIYTGGEKPMFSNEYKTATSGFKAKDKDNWTTVNFTFKLPDDWEGFSKSNINIGFPYQPDNEPVNASTPYEKRVSLEKASFYVGKEYAHDIVVSDDKIETFPGASFEVDADIVNQIGNVGDFDQNVIWIAMDADRVARVDGFDIAAGTDGKAEVTVDASVEQGTYTLVAVADFNKEFVKGIEIEVGANPYADYVPGERIGNMIPSNWEPSLNYNQRDKSGSGDEVAVTNLVSTEGGYRLMAMRDLGHPRALYNADYTPTGEYNYHHYSLSGSEIGYTKPATATTGNVVFSFEVKTNSDNEAYGEQKIQVGRRHYNYENTDSKNNEYPAEYSGVDNGFKLTTEYQTFKGTFADTGISSADIKGYCIGLPMGTKNGARALVKAEGAYLGYEYAYDLEVKASSETVAPGESVNVEATVLNQIGKAYAGTKEAITWKAMDTDRMTEIDGITIADGVVTVADTVEAGTYDVVAVYGDLAMAKGVTIEVTEAADEIEGITISATEGGITVSTDTALTNAQLIFVTYEGGKMVAVNTDKKVNLDAQGTQEYTIPDGFATAKVMLWSADFKPLANIIN